jgi:intracellular sulfur oxidation DsrE/DsrF family protein
MSPRWLAGWLLVGLLPAQALGQARVVQTPYEDQKVVFDFFLDAPEKVNTALYWLRALLNPLVDEPYNQAPEFMDLVVVIHGTEIVTTVKHNYEKYRDAVERMRYYASLGVKFKVCGLAAEDYGYSAKDFQEFVELVPSAMTELTHWQNRGYALIIPQVLDKKYSIEEIR